MATKIQLTLATLLAGFLIVGPFEAYTYLNQFQQLPYASAVFVIAPVVTLVGLLILWIGRFEWNGVLLQRFKHARRAFLLDIVSLTLAIAPAIAIAIIFVTSDGPEPSIPGWVSLEFGGAIFASFLFNFATYVFVAYELTARHGKVLLLAAFLWALVIASWMAIVLSQHLGILVRTLQDQSMDFKEISSAISPIEPYFALSYILLSIAYVDAYHREHKRIH